ncbi:thioredoxin domain-containing protein, partial [Mesorhizobium sp. M5C.F.Ca.IN.020.14.1.1]
FYTWSKDEIETDLGDDSALFFKHFTIVAPHGWEGKPIIHQTEAQQTQSVADRDRLIPLKEKMLAAREQRVRPGRDGKILTDWNGLVIAALAEAGRSLKRIDWIEAAEQAFAAIASAGRDSRLPHSMLGAKRLFPALSSDYAAMVNAAISLFEATGTSRYTELAGQFIAQLDQWHSDENNTGYYLTASDSADVPIRIRGDVDEAIPSATGQIIEAMVRLSSLSGDLELQEKTWKVAEHAAGRAAHQVYGQAGIVNACALAIEPLKLVLVDTQKTPGLVPVANRNPDPRRVDTIVSVGSATNLATLPGGVLPPTIEPGAWLCTGQVCLPVITDAEELERQLRRG